MKDYSDYDRRILEGITALEESPTPKNLATLVGCSWGFILQRMKANKELSRAWTAKVNARIEQLGDATAFSQERSYGRPKDGELQGTTIKPPRDAPKTPLPRKEKPLKPLQNK